jgi:hypothetical protein
MTTFKAHILTEPRMVMLGQSMICEPDANDVLDSLDGVYNESAQAMDKVAQLCGYQNIQTVLDIFAQKIVQNLISSAGSTEAEHMRIVDLTLSVLSNFLSNSHSCKKLANVPVIRQLAESHISSFNILQGVK